MALTPVQNEALIREIDEAVREDNLRSFWSRFGVALIALAVLALVAFGGGLLWSNHKDSESAAVSERFATVLSSLNSDRPDTTALKQIAQDGEAGYRAAAQLTEAGLALRNNDSKGAIALYAKIAADQNLAQPWRDLATVRQTALEFDTLPPQTVIDRLKPLAQAGNPWFGAAGEMSAMAYVKLKKTDTAGALFAAMAKDPTVPPTVQTRAVQMASLLGVDAQVSPRLGDVREDSANAN